MNSIRCYEDRLKKVIYIDKKENPQKLLRVIKSEMLYVLKNYMDICAEDLDVNIFVNDNGLYEFNIVGVCRHIKTFRTFEI